MLLDKQLYDNLSKKENEINAVVKRKLLITDTVECIAYTWTDNPLGSCTHRVFKKLANLKRLSF